MLGCNKEPEWVRCPPVPANRIARIAFDGRGDLTIDSVPLKYNDDEYFGDYAQVGVSDRTYRSLHYALLNDSRVPYDERSYNIMYYLKNKIRMDSIVSLSEVVALTEYTMEMEIPRMHVRTYVRDTSTNRFYHITELDCEVDNWFTTSSDEIRHKILPHFGQQSWQLIFVYNNLMCDRALVYKKQILAKFDHGTSAEFFRKIDEYSTRLRR